mgnify:CR=1 FL=1
MQRREILKKGWLDDIKREEYYDFICSESERLSRLVSNILQISKVSRNSLSLDIKEITINETQSYFDTNTSEHHHFFDENEKKLIDIENEEIEPIKLVKNISGKKITSIEVLVRVATDNQNQK